MKARPREACIETKAMLTRQEIMMHHDMNKAMAVSKVTVKS